MSDCTLQRPDPAASSAGSRPESAASQRGVRGAGGSRRPQASTLRCPRRDAAVHPLPPTPCPHTGGPATAHWDGGGEQPDCLAGCEGSRGAETLGRSFGEGLREQQVPGQEASASALRFLPLVGASRCPCSAGEQTPRHRKDLAESLFGMARACALTGPLCLQAPLLQSCWGKAAERSPHPWLSVVAVGPGDHPHQLGTGCCPGLPRFHPPDLHPAAGCGASHRLLSKPVV